MGYDTDFRGQFDLDKPLTPAHLAHLTRFSEIRHTKWKPEVADLPDPLREAVGLPAGPEGAYYVGSEGSRDNPLCLDPNREPDSQPDLYCQWIPNSAGTALVWDEIEKFREYVEWLRYLIEHFLKPWGYVLSGKVTWEGEEHGDAGTITVTGNEILLS